MARRTLGVSMVEVRLLGRPGDGKIPLDEIGPSGLLDLVRSWAGKQPDLTDPRRKIYTEVRDVHHLSRAVLLRVSTGSWGDDQREIVNIGGKGSRTPVDADDASTVGTRALFLCPPGADTALYFSEREGNFVGGTRAWDAIDVLIAGQGKVPDRNGILRSLNAEKVSVTLGKEWLAAAELREVGVRRHRPAQSWGSDEGPDELVYEQTLRPKQKGHLPKRILTRVLESSSKIEAADIVGLPGDGEVDRVTLTVEDGERTKTFEMSNPKSPALREVLNEHGEDVLDNDQFIDVCGDLAETFYTGLEEAFAYDWLR
ncbi:hypothetical protein HMPREF3159_13260 [Brachybacterium sp. HMSC06H03]|nr:hypothetical protein HMPREF3159_13260 [Brachybacterium sp. HMSC06H03]